jgi:hypothetical protein
VPQNLLTATSNLPQVLVSQFVGAGETTQYTAGSGSISSAVKIASATLCNTSAAAVSVSVSVCKAGTLPAKVPECRILSNYSLAAGDSIRLVELNGAMIGNGDYISAMAPGTGTAVSFVMTGAVSS